MSDAPPLSPDLVQEFVLNAHGNLLRVREMYEQEPALLNARWEHVDEDALQAAGHTGRRAIAEFLLERGAPLTVYAAAMLGRRDDVARFLAEDPALANRPGVHGFSALYHAALSGDTEVAEAVYAAGGTAGSDAALQGAARLGHTSMAAWLLQRGADPTKRDFEGKTPLELAEAHGNEELIQVLRG